MMKISEQREMSVRTLALVLCVAAAASGAACSRSGSGQLDLIVVFSTEVHGFLEACG